ncbi:hypothetical protein [Viscerimonas tarda]
MMTAQELEQIIEHNELPDISRRFEMRALIERYPYFQVVIFIYLKCLFVAGDKTFHRELQRLSLFITDRKALFYYILEDEYEGFFRKRGKRTEVNTSHTDTLLKTFFGEMDDEAIDRELEELLKPKQENYDITAINREENIPSPDEEGQSATDKILGKVADIPDTIHFDPGQESYKPRLDDDDSSDKLQDNLFFTETLATIFIKQQKYERAYEIIKQLSLNYPEKNIYFANQISFLEKLIINAKK